MKSSHASGAGPSRPALRIGLAAALFASAMLAHAAVAPPPLPAGSNLVKVEPGMDKQEQKREDRAHTNKNKKKDVNVDDSLPGNGNGNGNGKGNNK